MRHASQLCRGLAEATRSLERPYVPRHVPLPSSSYNASAQHSSTPTPPRPSTSHSKDRTAKSAPRREAEQLRFTKHSTASLPDSGFQRFQPSSPKPISSNEPPIDTQRGQFSNDASFYSASQSEDAFASVKRPTPTKSHEGGSHPSSVSLHPTTPKTNAVASHPGRAPRDRSRAASNSNNQGDQSTARGIKLLMQAYPSLSKAQANLLLQTFRQIHTYRSRPPTALPAWYEDLVWTTERLAQGSERTESSQSLCLLLRYVYQRNDLRSLLRLEKRAIRLFSTLQQSSSEASESALLVKGLGNYEVDGVSIWPEAGEDPRRLAFNLHVAYAAKEGNWTKVDELVSQPSSSKRVAGKTEATHQRETMLGPIGWSSLLRFGLGAVREPNTAKHRNTPTVAELTTDDPSSLMVSTVVTDPTTSLPGITAEEEQARQIQQDEAQAQAKLSVTKRLLPHLLRYTRTSLTKPSDTAEESSTTDPKTPAWLLQSVLTQLAERADSASTTRIAKLALSEKSIDRHALPRGGATRILNLVLVACQQNRAVNLPETLRVFNDLTGSTLGQGIVGSTVAHKAQERQSDVASTQRSEKKGEEGNLVPNEESIVLVLKKVRQPKVRHPLFRAAWSRKLVEEFQRLFPEVHLTGRTFRMILDNCIASAPTSQPRQEEAAPAATEHVVAKGRHGRRLRQAASKASTTPFPTSPPTPPPTNRGPIVKQGIVANTLQDILKTFSRSNLASPLHLSTTNRRKFEHTLLRTLRLLRVKKEHHRQKLSKETTREGVVKHHTAAIADIDRIIKLIGKVKRLGRREEKRGKRAEVKAATGGSRQR